MANNIKLDFLLQGTITIKDTLATIDPSNFPHAISLLHMLYAAQSPAFHPAALIFLRKAHAHTNPSQDIQPYMVSSPKELVAQLLCDAAKKNKTAMKHAVTCKIEGFSIPHVLKGNPVFHIQCPTCKHTNLINIHCDYVHRKQLLCPECLQKLVITNGQLVEAVKRTLLRMGKIRTCAGKTRENIIEEILICAFALQYDVDIYFIRLRAERIGHYAGNTYGFLVDLQNKGTLEKSIIFAFDNLPSCNIKLRRLLQRYISMPGWAESAFFSCREIPEIKHMAVDVGFSDNYILEYGQNHAKKPVYIEFTNAEHALANAELKRIGVEPGSPIVCFHGRDQAYLKTKFPQHDADIHDCRNMDIRTFIPTMQWFSSQGIYCLRIGSIVQQSISENSKYIIDCSNHNIDPLLDFYLPGCCTMLVSVLSGPIEFAYIKNTPTLIVNQFSYAPYTGSYLPSVDIIYKKYYSIMLDKYISCEDILRNNLNYQLKHNEFADLKLQIENNTAEEILEAAQEKWQRIQNKIPASHELCDEDAAVQARHRAVLEKYAYNKEHTQILSRISLSFVKKNPFFL